MHRNAAWPGRSAATTLLPSTVSQQFVRAVREGHRLSSVPGLRVSDAGRATRETYVERRRNTVLDDRQTEAPSYAPALPHELVPLMGGERRAAHAGPPSPVLTLGGT